MTEWIIGSVVFAVGLLLLIGAFVSSLREDGEGASHKGTRINLMPNWRAYLRKLRIAREFVAYSVIILGITLMFCGFLLFRITR